MAKNLFHIILTGVILFSQFYNTAVTVVYQLNKDYYANVLCENQDKPELKCKGQCHFNKQLSQQENQKPIEVKLLPSIFLFSGSHLHYSFKNEGFKIDNTPSTFFQIPFSQTHLSEIDHPPRT